MKRIASVLLSLACGIPVAALAQKAVPVADEPHHHLVFEDPRVRVFRVEVPAHSATLIHEHAVDYFWIAVGASQFVNAAVGKPEAPVTAADGSVHFTRGGFAHLARVDGDQPFHNVTIELPQAQTNPRNLCAAVIADQPVDCASAMPRATALFSGAAVVPEFETDQVRVTLITIPPRATLTLSRHKHAPVFVIVDDVPGSLPVTCPVVDESKGFELQARYGNTYPLKGTGKCTVRNDAHATVRLLAMEFAAAK
ncbi:MAG TPA: hypothetical protein VN613_09355 [Gemmatimonadaceae bacterium]|nr:hypothetical protein [Gemmatimonadaceae bacterium]